MILTYHQIEAQYSPHTYGVTAGTLAEHLCAIREHSALAGLSADFVATFDDGHISNYQRALPLLERSGCKALFFIPAGFVGNRPEVMTWEQLRELVRMGHEVGSHSWSHPLLPGCSDAQLVDELARSRMTLEDKLGVMVGAISIPHGSWNRHVLQRCGETGYRRVYTSDFLQGVKMMNGMQVVGRLTVRRTMTAENIRRFLAARGPAFWAAVSPYVIKGIVKGFLGEHLYYRVWRHMFARISNQEAQ